MLGEINDQESPAEYATYLIKNEASVLNRAFQFEGYRGPDLPKQIQELIFNLIQPIPFKRQSWEWIKKHSMLGFENNEAIKEDAQEVYTQQMQQLCQQGIFGEAYRAHTVESD